MALEDWQRRGGLKEVSQMCVICENARALIDLFLMHCRAVCLLHIPAQLLKPIHIWILPRSEPCSCVRAREFVLDNMHIIHRPTPNCSPHTHRRFRLPTPTVVVTNYLTLSSKTQSTFALQHTFACSST